MARAAPFPCRSSREKIDPSNKYRDDVVRTPTPALPLKKGERGKKEGRRRLHFSSPLEGEDDAVKRKLQRVRWGTSGRRRP